jgi:signal transduction histidine kinase
LPKGRYTFEVIPVDAFGHQSGIGVALPIKLVPPFYARWWFWSGLAVAGAIAIAAAARFVVGKRLRRQLEQAERRRAVEQERIRIAQDIHDDMGARMTQISLMNTAALRSTPKDSPTYLQLQRMDQAAHEVVVALDEIVWAVNPAHDTLEGFGNYLSQYVTEVVAGDSTRCRLSIPTLLPVRSVSSGVRHQLLMAAKEALNNALKYSGASEIIVRLLFADPILTVSVEDDGRGFAADAQHGGEGLLNMQRRLRSVGGRSEIKTVPGQGTTVTFVISLQSEPD